jgi:hypothetical protein
MRQPKTVQMVNPWSGACPPDRCWTWAQVKAWGIDAINDRDIDDWLREARRYFYAGNGKALGRMIIGS